MINVIRTEDRNLSFELNLDVDRALAGLVNREVAGEAIDDDERELVLMTLVREAKAQARQRRFGRE